MQKSLFDNETKKRYTRTSHGGMHSKGKRKLERPLSTKKWIHLVLKSEKAKGEYSFLSAKNKIGVERIIKSKARKFGIAIGDQANVGNHLHYKIRISSRENFQKFLKAITALIARFVTGARKGKPFGIFWQGLAFTRVLKSYREETNLRGYMMANQLEAATSYSAREKFLKKFNDWVYRSGGDNVDGLYMASS